jgi:hypothetical protein
MPRTGVPRKWKSELQIQSETGRSMPASKIRPGFAGDPLAARDVCMDASS